MTTITNHVALTQLHTQLKATIANTDSHPSLIVGVLINLVAELIARNVTPVGIETVTRGPCPFFASASPTTCAKPRKTSSRSFRGLNL